MFRIKIEFLPFGDESKAKPVAQGQIEPYGEQDYFVSPANYRFDLDGQKGTVLQVPKRESVWSLLASAIERSIELGAWSDCVHEKVVFGETETWCRDCGETVWHSER